VDNNNKSLSDAIKLAHLNNSINDRVREVIACLTGEPGDYQKAVKLLSDRYGDPREVVDAHLHRITNWHNIKEKDRDAFERFADALQAAVFALDKPDYRHKLSSMPLCTQVSSQATAQ
jgi:endonuclease III